MKSHRAGIHIERAALARLIPRFIDLTSSSCFVDDPEDVSPKPNALST